jgi:hypothetical protein
MRLHNLYLKKESDSTYMSLNRLFPFCHFGCQPVVYKLVLIMMNNLLQFSIEELKFIALTNMELFYHACYTFRASQGESVHSTHLAWRQPPTASVPQTVY